MNTPPVLRWRLPDDDHAAVEALLQRAVDDRVPQRLHERDDTLWGPAGQPEVSDRLGWLDAPAQTLPHQTQLEELRTTVLSEGFTDVILVGMGGSSLAPEVLWQASTQTGGLRLRMLDSTDPDAVATVDAATDADRTLVLVSTKSGGTLETVSLFRHFWARHPHGEAFVAVTDPGSELEALARHHGFRAIFAGDPQIGGRYSALSPFGVVPAALLGADLGALLHGGIRALDTARAPVPENAAVRLGVALTALARRGRDKLALRVQDPALASFGLWLEQLVAESTGKHGQGLLPVVDDPAADSSALRTTGPDRQLLVLRTTVSPPNEAMETELAESVAAGVPILELIVDGEQETMGALGAAFAVAEVAVAVTGWGLSINPFDQPDVQAAKDATQAVLAEITAGAALTPAADADAPEILRFVAGLGAPEYLAILAYVPPSPSAAEAIGRLRAALSARTDAAITIGFGPRYLHSTGQLHKGGPPGGRFLILEHDPRSEATIPAPESPEDGPPAPTASFRTLLHAQSEGDRRTLEARDRAVLRLNLGTDWRERLDALATTIEEDS